MRIDLGAIGAKDAFIAESLQRRRVIVADVSGTVAGFAVWDRAFFGRAFVWLLAVDPAYRRRGIAARLLRCWIETCAGEPLFISTNASNAPMHALLPKLGFERSGSVTNLDPGDDELFYYRAAAPRPSGTDPCG